MENVAEVAQPPLAEPQKPDFLPNQGAISQTYKVKDERTGNIFVHKVIDFAGSQRYGGNTPFERAKIMQRLHGVLSNVFEGHVTDTQFLIAKSSGQEKIEAIQPYIEGVMPNMPSDAKLVSEYIEEKSGGKEKLIKKLQKEAKVPDFVARMTAGEITAITNWVKDSKTGKIMLIDF